MPMAKVCMQYITSSDSREKQDWRGASVALSENVNTSDQLLRHLWHLTAGTRHDSHFF